MRAWLERVWYGEGRGGLWLRPLAALFGIVTAARRAAYRHGWLRSLAAGRPLVVIGNLTVGGSGKTPLTVWLAAALADAGLAVGIVSRGYGGADAGPLDVGPDTDPLRAGDEPVLLARRTRARVVIGRDRVAAARHLAGSVDVILADDGLQHYRLRRDLEIVVVDGRRRFGNARLLPAGPLREAPSRLATADFVVVNGGSAGPGEIPMRLVAGAVVGLDGGRREPLAAWAGRRVHAVAGIGDPSRFFALLRAAGLEPLEHPLPDHAPLSAGDVSFGDGLPVLMTEKDAVKCRSFPAAGLAWLEVGAEIDPAGAAALLARIRSLVPAH